MASISWKTLFPFRVSIDGLICFFFFFSGGQLVSESERLRLKKLEELSKNIDTIR